MSGNLFFQGMMYLITSVFGGRVDRTGEDGSSGSCDVCALYRYLYQSDSDSGRAYRDDAERTVRIRRFLDVIETEPEIVNAPDAEPIEEVNGHVSYESVSFHYSDDDTPVLSNVTFDIPAENR